MTHPELRRIRKHAGLSQSGLAALMRIGNIKTIQRWESGETPIPGPASIVLELIASGDLPAKYLSIE